jgi:hypothetical protein
MPKDFLTGFDLINIVQIISQRLLIISRSGSFDGKGITLRQLFKNFL